MPDVKVHNPLCATCNHVRSAHDFDSKYRHKRCTHQSEKDGVCECAEFTFGDNRG